ncbi:hypothetical protein P9B03_09805 [Metasolibacillus meyeri]|uniref:Toxin ETX/toxin MTX2 n=1 Tax=Metasolibacillus meyeri TaxID=1071052 RepID=A0AAW9NQJ9_9BACL|nr:hypothetical protein [Metasolibacillus meyeri]MEC1178776.1 hypothetical protein [Metasolibacillus meyeri]
MKKIFLLPFLVLTSLFFQNDVSANEMSTEDVNPVEYKEMMDIVKREVLKGVEENELEKIPEVQEFKNTYKEEKIFEFVGNTEAYKMLNSKNDIELNSQNNILGYQKQLIEFEDGSFAILESKTTEVSDLNSAFNLGVTPFSGTGTEYFNTKAGKSFTNDFSYSYWGLWKVAELHLITNFTIENSNKVKITSTDHAGTKAYTPSTVDNVSTSIIINNGLDAQSRGSYRKTNGVVIDGFPIGATRYISFNTLIRIHATSGSDIYFYVQNSITE